MAKHIRQSYKASTVETIICSPLMHNDLILYFRLWEQYPVDQVYNPVPAYDIGSSDVWSVGTISVTSDGWASAGSVGKINSSISACQHGQWTVAEVRRKCPSSHYVVFEYCNQCTNGDLVYVCKRQCAQQVSECLVCWSEYSKFAELNAPANVGSPPVHLLLLLPLYKRIKTWKPRLFPQYCHRWVQYPADFVNNTIISTNISCGHFECHLCKHHWIPGYEYRVATGCCYFCIPDRQVRQPLKFYCSIVWYSSKELSCEADSEDIVADEMPEAAKAASSGANTVKGPVPFRVPSRPALTTACSRRVRFPSATTLSVMVLPAAGVGSSSLLQEVIATLKSKPAITTMAERVNRFFFFMFI